MSQYEEYGIRSDELRVQRWPYYVTLVGWPVYLVLLPAVWAWHPLAALALMIFPGVYLYTWLAFLMHESWHRYVPGISHGFFYTLFSWFMLTDPQLYRLIHGFHHSQVNSWEDTEFHPFGCIQGKTRRILWSTAEVIFGLFAFLPAYLVVVPRHPRYRKKFRWQSLWLALAVCPLILFGLGGLSHWLFGVAPQSVAVSYAVALWLGALTVHHSQLVEHGNLIVDGDYQARNVATRNLPPTGWPEKVFLFLTHKDSREHVLHHTHATLHCRPFPNRIPLPEGAVSVRLSDYVRIAGRMLCGKNGESEIPTKR